MYYIKLENNLRLYSILDSCVFKKNEDEFGGLSNMSTSFKIEINGIKIVSTESIYQALKFPHDTELQKQILIERSPFTAKMISKKGNQRDDWNNIRVQVMKWCLQIKLAQNYYSFGNLLKSTAQRCIVESSNRDLFWGAKQINEFQLQGKNVLGRLLMELRESYLKMPKENILIVNPPNIDNFTLLKKDIGIVNTFSKYTN